MKNKTSIPEDENKIAKGATNANRPAFPSDFEYGDHDFLGAPVIVHKTSFGLTKREYFAAMAMQGMLANPEILKLGTPNTICEIVSIAAVEQADDLLKTLSN